MFLPLIAGRNRNGAGHKTLAEAVELIEKPGGAAMPLSYVVTPRLPREE